MEGRQAPGDRDRGPHQPPTGQPARGRALSGAETAAPRPRGGETTEELRRWGRQGPKARERFDSR